MLAALRGAATTPHVRSRISADEEAVIERSGHSVSAAPGALDLATTAGKRGRISDSPITITGAPTHQESSIRHQASGIRHQTSGINEEEQHRQLDLLRRYRDNLHHLLRQAADAGGEQAVVVATANAIAAQREAIGRIKAALRTSGVAVADQPNDEAAA